MLNEPENRVGMGIWSLNVTSQQKVTGVVGTFGHVRHAKAKV